MPDSPATIPLTQSYVIDPIIQRLLDELSNRLLAEIESRHKLADAELKRIEERIAHVAEMAEQKGASRREWYTEKIESMRELFSNQWTSFQATFNEFKSTNAYSLEKMNEFRQQLNDQAATLMTKEVAVATMQGYVPSDRLDAKLAGFLPRTEADTSLVSKESMAGLLSTVVTRDQLEQRSRQNLTTASAIAGIIAVIFSVIGTFFPRYGPAAYVAPTAQTTTPAITIPQPSIPVVPLNPQK